MNGTRVISGLTFCTIIRQGQIERVHALADSIHTHHPASPLFVLLLDSPFSRKSRPESFVKLTLEEIKLPDLARLRFLCTATALAGIARPHLLTHLFANHGARKLVYLDSSLLVAAKLRTLERRLRGDPIVVTPHLGTGELAGDEPALVALARGPEANIYLEHWVRKVSTDVGGEQWTPQVCTNPTPGVVGNSVATGPETPYRWQRFDNGVQITDLIRQCYRNLGSSASALGDPFVTAGRSFYAYLTAAVDSGLPPLLRAVYDERPDLQVLFPDATGEDYEGFLKWADHSVTSDHGLDPALLVAIRSASSRPWLALGGPVTEPFGVNVLGFLQSEKGMGEHSRATVRALACAEVPSALNNWVDRASSNVDHTYTDFTAQNPYPINLIHLNAADAPELFRLTPRYFAGHYNIGYWNWELEWFPEEWRSSFQYFDEIWAPSTFTRDSIARKSPIPVHKVPIAITVPPKQPGSVSRERFRLPKDAFLFLFAFDFHSFFARKNPLAAVAAFRRAFPDQRDVVLVLKLVHWESAPMDFSEVLMACRGQSNIHILRDVLSRNEMYDLLRMSDAYIGLHRSEGYGLPLVEAMALGKPVIATDYSANVDFMNEANGYPVRYKKVAIETDHGPYRKGAVWAEADVEHAAEQMRRVVDNPEEAKAVATRAAADMARSLSPQAVGDQMRKRLTAIVRRGVATGDPRFVSATGRLAA